jgi:hypothetical protein
MIYLLTHIGGKFPEHVKYSIRQIHRKNSNCTIYLCGDIKPDFIDEKYTFIHTSELNIPYTNYLINEPNPLWYGSLMRIFLINSFMQKENVEGIIHFDNDVMIYSDFTKLINQLDRKNYITPHKYTEYTFGFSYLNNKDEFNILTDRIIETIAHGESKVRQITGDEIHEMRLLGLCGTDLISPLPVHPEIGSINEFIFDPSSYGQYIGGTPNGHSPGFIDKTQLVGNYFSEQKPDIIYNPEDEIFHYRYADKIYKIFNLHVHSKKLEMFLL